MLNWIFLYNWHECKMEPKQRFQQQFKSCKSFCWKRIALNRSPYVKIHCGGTWISLAKVVGKIASTRADLLGGHESVGVFLLCWAKSDRNGNECDPIFQLLSPRPTFLPSLDNGLDSWLCTLKLSVFSIDIFSLHFVILIIWNFWDRLTYFPPPWCHFWPVWQIIFLAKMQ